MLKGYRTLILSLATSVLGVLMAFDWTGVTSVSTAGLIVTALGVAATVLRFFTDGPVGAPPTKD